MNNRVLAINPGSTSTKFAIYDDGKVLFEHTLRHGSEEIEKFESIKDQKDWRMRLILEGLEEANIDVKSIDAVVGRGGLVKPIEGGIYIVNEALERDTRLSPFEHACNLGAPLAHAIADKAGVHAYIADPVVVDEMTPLAKVSGHPMFPRVSAFHALNSRAIGKHYAKDMNSKYEDLNLIIVHMGGGVSVSVHQHGRIVDTTNALSGNGCFSPERVGRIQPMALVDACYSGKYTKREMSQILIGHGGLVAHLGSNSMYDAVVAAQGGDEKSKLIVDAFVYNVSKDVGAMSTVLSGKIDAILITGGIAYNEFLTGEITKRIGWMGKVAIYPGEDELGALVGSTMEVLRGETTPKIYE